MGTSLSFSFYLLFLLDDTTRLVLIYKAILGESLDGIILNFLLLLFLLTFSLLTDHLLDVSGGFLRQHAALGNISASASVQFRRS